MQSSSQKPTVEPTRRDFLRRSVQGVSGAVLVVAGAGAMGPRNRQSGQDGDQDKPAAAAPPPTPAYNPHDHRYAFLMDISKCIGCGACVRACERENQVPAGYFRTWIERYTVSRGGHVKVDCPNGGRDSFPPLIPDRQVTKSFFVPKLCNHCTETPCVQLCPVGASFRSPDGLILVDSDRCIGCGYCVQACPYGSRFMHPVTHTASKCTLCYHRIAKGLRTACEQACPTGARKLGDLKKPGDPVAEAIATENVQVMKPELHTEPNCFYLGMSSEVR